MAGFDKEQEAALHLSYRMVCRTASGGLDVFSSCFFVRYLWQNVTSWRRQLVVADYKSTSTTPLYESPLAYGISLASIGLPSHPLLCILQQNWRLTFNLSNIKLNVDLYLCTALAKVPKIELFQIFAMDSLNFLH